MIWKIVLVLGVAVGLNGDEEAVSEQKVTIHHPKHTEIISQAGDKQENHKDYEWSYPSYEFSYKVKDPHTHDIKGQKEERDGDKVKGDYWLIEPTGRKRTVKYHADEIGFNAHVDYTKSEYGLKEKNLNNQVEGRRVNSQEDEQLEVQKNDNDSKVTEGNRENENNNENGENENSGDQRGNIQEEGTSQNQKGNGGADLIEQNENNNNNENQLPINEAMVTLEALNENIEPQCNCKCNERRQIDYRNNINQEKNKNNNNGGQENTLRRKRKNMNRSINFKNGDNGENIKKSELDTAEKNHNKKFSHSAESKKSQNNNLNDKRNKNDGADFGSRNGKRKQSQTRDENKYEDQQQNKTVKHEEIKETKSENIHENDNDHKYQHRILIHHPKIVAQKASKKS